METFGTERERTRQLAASTAQAARDLADGATAGELEEAAAHLERGKLTVAVVGEFKRGKSSLLNALVQEPGLFPVDTLVATNLVTTLTHGERERVVVHVEGRRDKVEALSITRAEIPDYVTEQGNKGNRRRARLLEIELPSERLQDGLTFVDTPGVGGLVKEHTEITYGFVLTADVVLFVLDALVPLSSEELDFIERIGSGVKALMFVVTKIDQSSDPDAVVENTRAKVASVLGAPGEGVAIVAVSSSDRLRALKTGDDELLADSNFGALEDALWELLRRRGGALLLLRALGTVAGGLDRLLAPRVAELEVLEATSAEEIERASAGRVEAAERNKELRSSEAGWRKRMSREWDLELTTLDGLHAKGAAMIKRRYVEALDSARLMDAPEEIIGLVSADLALLAQDDVTQLESSLHAVVGGVSDEIGVTLNAAAPSSQIAITAGAPDLANVEDPTFAYEKRVGVARGALAGVMMGATVGSLAVPVIGTIIGGLVGGALLGRSAVRGITERDRGRRRMLVEGHVRTWLEESLGEINNQRVALTKRARNTLNDAFDAALQEENERLKAQTEASDRARAATKQEAEARLAELRGPVQRLQSLRLATGRLAATVAERADGAADAAVGRPVALGDRLGGPPATAAAPPAAAAADLGDWADD